jgi:hypothetical protein
MGYKDEWDTTTALTDTYTNKYNTGNDSHREGNRKYYGVQIKGGFRKMDQAKLAGFHFR